MGKLHCKGNAMNWKKRLLLSIGRTILNIFARLFLEFNVHYEAPLKRGAKIFAANHPTTTDPFLMSLVTEEPLTVLVNKRIMQISIIGRLIEQAGTIPVDKENKNSQEIIQRSLQVLEQDLPIAVFPEGCLTPSVNMLSELHTGVTRIALAAHATIVPVGIYVNPTYIRRHFFHRKYGLEESRWLLHGKYYITIGKPLRFEGDVENRELVKEFTNQVGLEIKRLMLESELRAVQKGIAWNPIIPFAREMPRK